MRTPVVVVGSSNGSHNYGDDMMWLATVNALRVSTPEVPVITDSSPGWLPSVGGVETLPFMHDALLRYRVRPSSIRLANKAQAALGLALNRDALSRGLRRQEELADGASAKGRERQWERAIGRSQGMIFSGAGGLTDTFALHAIAGWGIMIALAHRQGVPVIMLGQGVGPLHVPASRAALGRSLERVDLVTTRDSMSAREVRTISPHTKVCATIDWAVLETPSSVTQQVVDAWLSNRSLDRFVVASLHDWRPAPRDRRRQMADVLRIVVEAADRAGCEVILVPNMVGIQRSDDRIFMRDAASSLRPAQRRRVRSAPDNMTAFETRALIARAAGVFASRYHPGVFALASGVPFTGIAYDVYYEQKHVGALSWYGEIDRVHTLDEARGQEWWDAGIDVTRSSFEARKVRTEHLRREAVTPFNEWIASKHIK